MSVSLYRRYRPQTFEEIAGQETVVDVLKKTLQRGKIGHAWLFSGPRGCGKTSAARLLAKALNCLDLKDGYEPCGSCEQCVSISAGESLDVIEIDGASNNGVEEIRELKTHVSLSPFSAKWKVYIIDEVHMLSISAFNALLKTLEEPPPLVAFILATTEPHKIPATIRSRCQHIPFQRIDMRSMCARLEQVAVEEKAPFDPEAIRELARNSDGALRDALSLMEQAMTLGNGEVSKEAVDSLLGGGTLSDLERWVASIKEEEVEPFACLVSMFQKGASPQRIVEGVFLLFRNLWAVKRWGELVIEPLFLSVSEADFLSREVDEWTLEQLSEMMLYCSKLIPQVRTGMRTDVLSGLLAAKVLECRALATLPPAEVRLEERPRSVRDDVPAKPTPPAEKAEPVPKPAAPVRTAAAESPPALQKEPAPPRDGPLSEEAWREFERHLFSDHLHLGCLLVEAEIELKGDVAEITLPDDAAYGFATLSSERNGHQLLSAARGVLGKDKELLVKWRDESCRYGEEDPEAETPNADEATTEPPPAERKPRPPAVERPRSVPAGQERLPFEDLVDEVLRWTDGEVVMVKREESPSEQDGDLTEMESN